MIPKAREVRLKPKVRKVLEARCRAPTTAQRDVKRARIVLLAAEGRSTRSIAEEVSVQPRIVSHWRRRFAEHGLGGLKDRPRAGKKPIYCKATNKRILVLLENLSSEPKCNTPADLIIGTVDQDLRECCHAMLFAFVG